MAKVTTLVLFGIAAVAALPHDPIIRKLGGDIRCQYVEDSDGALHLVDLWGKLSDLAEAARYNPDRENVYHLFTRENPTVSQAFVLGNEAILATSNFNPKRRTVVLVHGWLGSATTNSNRVLVPVFLAAEDLNVIAVDWPGATTINYLAAVANTVTSGQSVARFIGWLNNVTGADVSQYHLVGFSLGGQQVGIIGRNLDGKVPYITALDPALPGWKNNDNKFKLSDGIYTEIINTNAGQASFKESLGDVSFYPNGGQKMPGCVTLSCNHERSYFYMAESLTSGGFTGTKCLSYEHALVGDCDLPETLEMGGLEPKTGKSGEYYLETNASPPFSRG